MRSFIILITLLCVAATAYAGPYTQDQLFTRYEVNAIYDVWGEHDQTRNWSTTPYSVVVARDSIVYAQVHHDANETAVEANIDGWAAATAYYDFFIYNTANPNMEGAALVTFTGSSFAAAKDGYARAHMSFTGWDIGGPWYHPWDGTGSGFNGNWYFSETDSEVGHGAMSGQGDTGVETKNYSVVWNCRYNQKYRVEFFAHATAWSHDTPNLDYFGRAWIDPVIGVPEGMSLVVADLGSNPDFPIIYPPSEENPYGAFVPVPAPATMLLLGSGLVGLTGFRRKLKKL